MTTEIVKLCNLLTEQNYIMRQLVYCSLILIYVYFMMWPFGLLIRLPQLRNISRMSCQSTVSSNFTMRKLPLQCLPVYDDSVFNCATAGPTLGALA